MRYSRIEQYGQRFKCYFFVYIKTGVINTVVVGGVLQVANKKQRRVCAYGKVGVLVQTRWHYLVGVVLQRGRHSPFTRCCGRRQRGRRR